MHSLPKLCLLYIAIQYYIYIKPPGLDRTLPTHYYDNFGKHHLNTINEIITSIYSLIGTSRVAMKTNTPLLPVTRNAAVRRNHPVCLKRSWCISSKASRVILLWNFAVLLAYKMFFDINAYMQVNSESWVPIILDGIISFVVIFSPIAGLLTDVKFSRFRVVMCTSYIFIAKIFIILVLLVVLAFLLRYATLGLSIRLTRTKILAVVAGCILLLMITVYMVFIVNGIQLGMDQLHDSSTEDSILYIHWYVWIYYTCSLITETSWNLLFYDSYHFNYIVDTFRTTGYSLTCLQLFMCLILIAISLRIVHYKKVWFLFEPAGVNPYKLVYRVVKFAYQHKVPLRRSAFTYCDEESQTRLDVGKHKYGGPFTTKQVEDVKAFWGILKVLISIGPAFLLQTVMQSLLPLFAKHGNKVFIMNSKIDNHREVHPEGSTQYILISNGLLSPLLVVVCIPLYLCCIRPHIKYYIPRIMKRIQLAIVVMILSIAGAFVMDIVVHVRATAHANCIFWGYTYGIDNINSTDYSASPLYQNVYFFTTQHVLSALADMLFDIAVLEFICSQSPYSMKGLLLGIFFSIRSLFQGIAIISILPFGTVIQWNIKTLSCGSAFYTMHIVMGLLEFILFTCVSKRYKYRDMNEPSNEYRYAEEYYSNIQ